MVVIKAFPEDFVVEETGSPEPSGSGPFAYFVLQKRGWNTLDALETIGAKVGAPLSAFGWAGNKDKQAVTTQVCSVKNVSGEKLEALSINGITITYLGQGSRPIALGLHTGNTFRIVIRDIDALPAIEPQFVNYFGEQRMGSHNAIIGRCLVKREFGIALKHLVEETDRGSALRRVLEKNPNDIIGALRTVPTRLLILYIHAYQSSLWNAHAALLSKHGYQDIDVPLVGFAMTESQLETFSHLREQLKAEGITPRDFVIRQFPELSSEGATRALFAAAKALSVGPLQDDEMRPAKKKVTVSFTLDKGAYATEFVRQAFSVSQDLH